MYRTGTRRSGYPKLFGLVLKKRLPLQANAANDGVFSFSQPVSATASLCITATENTLGKQARQQGISKKCRVDYGAAARLTKQLTLTANLKN